MFTSEETVVKHGGTPTDTRVLDQTDWSVYHKQCESCQSIKPFGQFRRDSSYKEGVRNQCLSCESVPRLNMTEHVSRAREMNFNNEQTKAQRWGKDQLDFMDDRPRMVGYMHHSDFLRKLNSIAKYQLYIRDGNFVGDLVIYKVWEKFVVKEQNIYSETFNPNEPTFEYICYLPMGYSPEFSIIYFDDRAIPIRESQRGWRTVLLRLINSKIVTEEDVNKVFGRARGVGAVAYNRQLYRWRNRK